MKHEEYAAQDATSLSAVIRDGDIGAAEVLAAARARLSAGNPIINAVVAEIDPPAQSADEGMFAGVPFLMKDMDGYLAGYPCTTKGRSDCGAQSYVQRSS